MLARLIGRIYRGLPIKGGQTRLSFNPLIERLMQGYRDPAPARLWDGTRIMVDPHDYHGRVLFLFGTNDIKVSLNANLFLAPGDVFLDIGANYSTIGLSASRAVGLTGAVHLFEPQRRLADRVEEAINGGGYRNVHLHRCGLMDVDGVFTIRAPANHSGRATFAEHAQLQTSEFNAVEDCVVHEIERYVAPLVAGRSFGVKLDIEGSEPRVMPWLLAQSNLKFMIFEANHNYQELFDAVEGSGLTLFGLERTILRLRLRRIDDIAGMRAFHDLIALRLRPGTAPPITVDPRRLRTSLAVG